MKNLICKIKSKIAISLYTFFYISILPTFFTIWSLLSSSTLLINPSTLVALWVLSVASTLLYLYFVIYLKDKETLPKKVKVKSFNYEEDIKDF